MKLFNKFCFIILSVLAGSIASTFAMEDKVKPESPRSILPLDQWSNDQLLEIASLLKEQRLWVLLIDSLVNNISDQNLDMEVQMRCRLVRELAGTKMEKGGYDSVATTEEQKKKGMILFLGLSACVSHYDKKGFVALIDALARYRDIGLLSPLRDLLILIHNHDNVSNEVITKELMVAYDLLERHINDDIVRKYKLLACPLKTTFNAILDLLVLRTFPNHVNAVYNVFTGAHFVTEIEREEDIDQLLSSVVVEADKKMNFDIGKLPTSKLHEIATLLHEQAYLIMVLDALVNNTPSEKLDPLIINHCESIRQAAKKATERDALSGALSGCSEIEYVAAELFSLFSNYFEGVKDQTSLLFKLLADYPYKELAPLCKLTQQFKTLRSISKLMKLGIVAKGCQSIPSVEESIAEIRDIFHQHDSMHGDLNNLYTKITSELRARSRSRKVRQSLFSYRFMPASYCKCHAATINSIAIQSDTDCVPTLAPAIAVQCPVIQKKNIQKSACLTAPKQKLVLRDHKQKTSGETHPLDIYELQEYFLKHSDASNPVYFSQTPPGQIAPMNVQSFVVD